MTAVSEIEFAVLPELIRRYAQASDDKPALVVGDRSLSYRDLDDLMDRIAAALQRDGVISGDAVAACAATSLEYAAVFLGVLRAGAAIAPLVITSSADALIGQVADCDAKLLFLDHATAVRLNAISDPISAKRVLFDGDANGIPLGAWLVPEGVTPAEVAITPEQPFNIIYSSGTTGTPKGIVQSHRMRWLYMRSAGYTSDSVTLISTPLYSNTSLVGLLPTLAHGGTVVLMEKFDAEEFLTLSQKHRVTNTILVPVQYRRILDHPKFDSFDLASYRMKYVTSAPFSADAKAEVLRRWPGGLVEFYGMTEGGAACALRADRYPEKLHTVGRPLPGHVVKLIGEDGMEVPNGEIGEVVGRSPAMMNGYHNQKSRTREVEWLDPEGSVYIRTGDLGWFDEDGFLTIVDRKKDMIISGGFNIYPSDLEAVITGHPSVVEASVVGVPSSRWGETPVAFVVVEAGASVSAAALRDWANGRLGKTQRVSDLRIVKSLPRSAVGKVLKRELRESYDIGHGRLTRE